MQQLHILVSLTARTDRLVSVAGLKNAWRIPEDDSLQVDNGLFVLFRTNNQSLANLIFESNDNVSLSLSSRKNKSLRCSAGLLELLEHRNKAQVEDFQSEDCKLFAKALAKS